MPRTVEVVRTFADVERLASAWDAAEWGREEAERPMLVARTRARPEAVAPFGVLAIDDGATVAALAGRIDERRLATSFGYKVVYAPRVRLLHVVDGGIHLSDPEALDAVFPPVREALAAGEVDAVALPYLPVGSPALAGFGRLAGPLRRRLSRPHRRWRLVLPATFDEFLASRSANTRWRLRRDARRLEAAFGDELHVEVLREPADCERLFAEVERVARTTYQRALGAGFADTPERRAVTAVGLEHGWVRAYLLYRRGEPIAFWVCSLHRGTLLVRQTGYDQRYAELRVGLYLLTRAIELAIGDPEIAVVDFGQGEAAYKQQLGSESWEERDLLLFAPTLRGVRINATRNAILAAAGVSRRAADAAKLTDRIRSGWRGRLRPPA
jgi:hypothetical protein